jgi:MFS family permease
MNISVEPFEADVAARELAYDKYVQDNLRRNYLGNYLHGMLGLTGFRLINAPTFLPAYLYQLSGSTNIVGLSAALQQVGGIISPILTGAKVQHHKKVMPLAMWMGGLGRLAVLAMALAGWLLTNNEVTVRVPFLGRPLLIQPLVWTLLFCIFVLSVFLGAQRVLFSLVLSKVIPLNQRGRLQAWRNFSGGAVAAVLAYVAGRYFIGMNLWGNGYSTTFLFAFVLTSLGLSALQLLLREPEAIGARAVSPMMNTIREFPSLIRSDRHYALFLFVQMLATSARVATPFYIIYVARVIGGSGTTLGMLSFAFLIADTGSNLLWGYLGDKTGFRLVLILAVVTWAAATVMLMSLHVMTPIVIAFAGLGAAQAGYNMAVQTMVLEFGKRHDLPMRIAVSATAEGITATAGPLIGGLVAQTFGYSVVFGASLGLLGVTLILLLVAVEEPRRRRR